ncbi:MAG: hypothetical protein OEW48_06345, partial [Phycisphaerae bacterium]|nr:hypothetical protein [Phycisphaerae bacterium]
MLYPAGGILDFEGGIFFILTGIPDLIIVWIAYQVLDLRSLGRKPDKDKKAEFRIGGKKWIVQCAGSQWLKRILGVFRLTC